MKVDLQVRGICCLRTGISGVSDHITVSAIVGRFLEHARIYYFHNGGNEEIFLGSSDLMPRNLDRRVEVLFPVDDPRIKKTIVSVILPVQFSDTLKGRQLQSDGTYIRRVPPPQQEPMNAQSWLVEHRGRWNNASR